MLGRQLTCKRSDHRRGAKPQLRSRMMRLQHIGGSNDASLVLQRRTCGESIPQAMVRSDRFWLQRRCQSRRQQTDIRDLAAVSLRDLQPLFNCRSHAWSALIEVPFDAPFVARIHAVPGQHHRLAVKQRM